jgi:hypothetical protein
MTHLMKIGINKMNYMFYGNNYSFVVFHLPLRTGRTLSVFSRIWSELEPIWMMIGSLDAFSSTPILTIANVDSFTYFIYFLFHWGKLSPFFC